MAIDISCPSCGENDDVTGVRSADSIVMTCGSCSDTWSRPLAKKCPTCGGDDLQTVPLAIVEKSRGTQLSMVGTRPVDLCHVCDTEKLKHYNDHRPSPLMPDTLPTSDAGPSEA